MYRKIMKYLEEWKASPHRKPLILQGARQVGKTYSILEFGRTHYENVAYFNFESTPKLNETFDENISPDYLIPILSHIAGQTIKTRDCDMTIYYSDDPRIMLGWFAQDERWCLRFKFLDRFEDISATAVRALLETPNVPPTALEAVLPHYVLIYKEEIKEYLKNAI